MARILTRFPHLPSLGLMVMSLPAYFLAYQQNPALHFGIGRWDGAFLGDPTAFYPPVRLSGPFRNPDGSVEVREFVGRLTKRETSFHLPFHAVRSPIVLTIRCHRFGQQGTVVLRVNDHHIRDFLFTKTSYPWGGIRAIVPQDVAESGPLRITLAVQGGDEPPSHLPPDFGLGVDWLEVAPMSRGAVLLPTPGQWVSLLLLLLSAFAFLRLLPATPAQTTFVLLLITGSALWMLVAYSVTGQRVVSAAWLVFPVALLALRLAELIDSWRRTYFVSTNYDDVPRSD
ncbi:MAG TPA: hypothetical protein VEK15_14800 [Vicinamibacteria bacterium]|nr:hypothetical protein [Vicinamibacteria bacterium]